MTGRSDVSAEEMRSRIEALGARVAAEIADLSSGPLAPGLHVVATPIGNLGDVTLRALATLARADVVLCEDTRHSARLLQRYALHRPLSAYHEHNAARERPRILRLLAERRSVALISDAGTPLVSDPGFKLVRAAAEAGHPVLSVPGPSAATAALSISGLPTDQVLLAGFLPPRPGQRRERLAELALAPAALVLFEAPGRLAAALADMAAVLGDRPAAVAREITKLHEEVLRGGLDELAAWAAAGDIRGEITIVVGPPPQARPVDDAMILDALAAALRHASRRDAVAEVAEALGVGRRRVYNLAILNEHVWNGLPDRGRRDDEDGPTGA